jgi:hypothetical protein
LIIPHQWTQTSLKKPLTRDSRTGKLEVRGSFYSAEISIDDLDSALSFLNGKDIERKECGSPAIAVAILVGSGFREPAHGRIVDRWPRRGTTEGVPCDHPVNALPGNKIAVTLKLLDTSRTSWNRTEAKPLL